MVLEVHRLIRISKIESNPIRSSRLQMNMVVGLFSIWWLNCSTLSAIHTEHFSSISGALKTYSRIPRFDYFPRRHLSCFTFYVIFIVFRVKFYSIVGQEAGYPHLLYDFVIVSSDGTLK